MITFKLVKRFREKASWYERLFGHFLLIAGNIRIAPRRNLLRRKEYSIMAGKLQVGDLVFAGSKREISRFFMRGDLSHTLIYLGKKKLIHSSVEEGVTKILLKKLFSKYDFLVAYRHAAFTKENEKEMMKFFKKSRGKAYDFRFLEGNEKEFSCTKFVELAYREAGIALEHRREESICPYVSTTHPEDFLLHEFEKVFSSKSLYSLKKVKEKKWPLRFALQVVRLFLVTENI